MAEERLPASSVRQPVWQGVQPVAGWWLPAWLPAPERTRRLLALWQPGSRAFRFAQGDVLCLPQARAMDCARAPGVPLCRVGDVLCAAPLNAREQQALPAADVALVIAGRLHALQLAQGQALDLSEAVDLRACRWCDTFVLDEPDPLAADTRLRGQSPRDVLGAAIPPQSAQSKALQARLLGGDIGNPGAQDMPQARPRLADRVLGAAVGALLRWGRAQPRQGRQGAAGVPQRQAPGSPQPWRNMLVRMAQSLGVDRLIGRQQAAFLRRTMAMFERGDLAEALRHALPLGALQDLQKSLGQSFSTPGRRADLQLSGRLGPGTAIHLSAELEAHLRRLYRSSFERLDRAGRIDEAVFVLAELLGARQEALDYLSEHGRHAQAAELALAWDMPPALTIRLLLLAGDAQRAVLVARRDQAFSAAIHQLQDTHPALADELRLAWGHALVDAGDWLQAVNVVWPLGHARPLARTWLHAAEQAGGDLPVQALAQRAALLPDTLAAHADRIRQLADPGAAGDEREPLARSLLGHKSRTPGLRELATAVLPAIAADTAARRNRLARADIKALLKLSGDPFLADDLPLSALPATQPQTSLWKQPQPLRVNAPPPGQHGLHAVHDAAPLPGRRHLVALGEAGMAEVDAQGRVLRRHAAPAHRLVIADSGEVALALAAREERMRVTRLDLVRHAMRDLGHLALRFAAPSFDGIAWTVVVGKRILVIDSTTPAHEVMWQVADLPGDIVAAEFQPDGETYWLRSPQAQQLWTYALPGRRLQPPATPQPQADLPWVLQAGRLLQPAVVTEADGSLALDVHLRTSAEPGLLVNTVSRIPLRQRLEDGAWTCSHTPWQRGLVVGLHQARHSRFVVVDLQGERSLACVHWPRDPAESRTRVRALPGRLLFHDATGRLLTLDLDTSAVQSLSLR